MGCRIRVNRHGYLAYRLRWNGRESHEGTGLRDTPKNRATLEARACVITDEIRAGTFDYLRWFPEGNKTYLFRPAPLPPPRKPLTVGEYAAETWLPRKVPPLVRASLAQTYRKHLRTHILPVFSDTRLDAITVSALEAFRMGLIDKVTGKGLAVKTARDMIDGSFRALFRDARKEELVTGDPFAALDWPDKVDPEPDPFTEEERDILLDYYWRKDRHWFPFVFTQFFTGLRPGEAIGLRRGALDLRRGRLSVRASRTLGEDNPPKTKKSKRTITVRPEVVAVLRDMPQPLHVTADDFVFTTADRATGRRRALRPAALASRPPRDGDSAAEVLRHAPHVHLGVLRGGLQHQAPRRLLRDVGRDDRAALRRLPPRRDPGGDPPSGRTALGTE